MPFIAVPGSVTMRTVQYSTVLYRLVLEPLLGDVWPYDQGT